MSPTLALIADHRQYAKVVEQYPEAIIATNDSSVFFAASMDGRTAVDIWCYLSEEEIRDVRTWTIDVCRQIGRTNHASFWCGKRNLVAMSQFSLRYPLLTIRLGSLVFPRLLGELKPTVVLVFSESERVNHEVSTTSSADVFNVVAGLVAAASGVKVVTLSLAVEKEAFPAANITHSRTARIEPLDLSAIERIQGLCAANDNCVREQSMLNQFLALRGPVREWLVVGTQFPQQKIPYLPIKAILWLADSLESRAAVDPLAVKQDVLSGIDTDLVRIMQLDHPRFDFVWIDMAHVCRVSLAWYRAGQFLSRLFHPQMIITGYDIYSAGRNFTAGLVDEGGRVLAIDHGTLIMDEFTYQYESGESILVVRGEVDRQHLAGVRGGEDRVFAAGCLRDDHLTGADHSIRNDFHEIIILTGKTTSGADFSGWTGCANLAAAWEELKTFAAGKPEWNFVIKCHPRSDTIHYYRHLVAGMANMRIEPNHNPDLYQHAIAAVMMNNATTSSLYAMEANAPVIYLRNAMYQWTTSPFDREPSIPKCRDIGSLCAEIERLFRDADYRASLVLAQKQYHGRVYSRIGLDAARSLIDRAESVKVAQDVRARNPADMVSVALVSIAHAYLDGGITLRDAAIRLGRMRRQARDIEHASKSQAAVFRYIVWSDDVNAGRFKRLLLLLATSVLLRSLVARSGFRLRPHILALIKPPI